VTSVRTPDLREILADLPYLIAVADTGGVGAAADELGVPQSTVSRSLARLAGRLGAPVLARRGRGVELTSEAASFLPYARRALDEVLTGAAVAARRAQERDSTATVAFQHTLGRTVVPALLRAVLERRPDTRFELHQGSRDLCVDALENRHADIVLLSPPYEGAEGAEGGEGGGVRTLRLYAEPLVLAVPPQHPLARRRRIRLRELDGEVLLQMRPEFGLRGQVDRILGRAGVVPRRGFEGEDIHTLRGLVAAGLGVAILPMASPPPTDVVEIAIADADATREIGISWRTGEDSSSAARTVFELAARPGAWLPER
jgi:DNA-binding transcriptional LysR family regulator